MVATPYLDDNPCRPAPFQAASLSSRSFPRARRCRLSKACRSRLLVTAVLFALVFAVVGLRVAEISASEGGAAQSHIGRLARRKRAGARAMPISPTATAMSSLRRSTAASLYAVPKQILDPAEATGKIVRVFPQASAAPEVYAKLTSGKKLCMDQAPPDAARTVRRQSARDPGLEFEHEERRIYPGGGLTSMSWATPGSTTPVLLGSSGPSTTC